MQGPIPRAEPERNKSGRTFGEQGVERARNPEGARPGHRGRYRGARLQTTGKTLKGHKPRNGGSPPQSRRVFSPAGEGMRLVRRSGRVADGHTLKGSQSLREDHLGRKRSKALTAAKASESTRAVLGAVRRTTGRKVSGGANTTQYVFLRRCWQYSGRPTTS